jgi:hypothetical protein
LETRSCPSVTISIINGVLEAECDQNFNSVFVDHSGTSAVINGQSFPDAQYNSIRVDGGSGGLTAFVHANVKNLAVYGNSFANGATDTVYVGNANSLSGIQSLVDVHDAISYATLNVDDSADSAAHNNVVVTATSISGLAPALISYQHANLSAVYIYTGTGSNIVNVPSTPSQPQHNVYTALVAHSRSTTVNVGNAGSLSGIAGPLSVTSQGLGYTALNVDDSADNANHTNVTVSSLGISGLAPAQINYGPSELSALNVSTGTGTNTVNVWATRAPLGLVGHSGATTVNVGFSGNVQDIESTLTITNPPSYTGLNVDDHADTATHNNVVVTAGSITGLAPAAINYLQTDLEDLLLSTGTDTNTVYIQSTPSNANQFPFTELYTNSNSTTVNLGNGGNLGGIRDELIVTTRGSYVTMNVDDSADAATHNDARVDSQGIFGLAPGPIYDYGAQLSALSVSTGTGTNTVNDLAALYPLNLAGHSATTTVNAGSSGSLQYIRSTLTITNPPSYTHVNIDDSADTSDHGNVALMATSLTGLAPAAINFGPDDLASLAITGGSGNNVYNIFTTQGSGVSGGNLTTLNTGSGRGTVYLLGDSGAGLVINGGIGLSMVNLGSSVGLANILRAVTINDAVASTHVNVNDGADTTNHPNARLSLGGLTGLAPAPINFGPSAVIGLTINDGRGNDVYTIAGCPSTTVLNAGPNVDAFFLQGLQSFAELTVSTSAGSGADTITLGDASQTLSGLSELQTSITLTGRAGDALNLYDQGYASARTYTVTPTRLTWSHGPPVGYSGLSYTIVNGSQGGDTFDLSAGTAASNAVTLYAGRGSNQLIGSASGNTWQVTGPSADVGYLSGAVYGGAVSFYQVGSLTGGSGGDTFRFQDQATLSGNLAGGGNASLDYSLYSTSVIVDLQTGFATGVGGSVSGISTVIGGSGAPGTPGLYNLLIGSGGNTLTGGTGRRNILVAGGSASTLNAGDGEDLLIGGSTIYDSDPNDPGLANWQQIAAYWAGTDDFFTRVANVTSGNSAPLLDATTVFGNNGGNTMNGNGALALTYSDGTDNISGFDPNSIVVPINP